MYLNVVRRKLQRKDNSFLFSCVSPENDMVLLKVVGFEPFCFIRTKDEHSLTSEDMNKIDRIQDEGFITLFGEPCKTIYGNTYDDIRQLSFLKKQKVLQADVSAEVSATIKYGLSNFLKLQPHIVIDKTKINTIHYKNIRNMTADEIIAIDFPKAEISSKFLDIEVLSTQEGFPKAENPGDKTICIVVDTQTFLLLPSKRDAKLVQTEYYHAIFEQTINVHLFFDEKKLLTAVHEFLKQHVTQYVIAWNSKFDEKWLKERCIFLGLYLNWDLWQWVDIQRCYANNLDFSTNKIKLKEAFNLLYQYKRGSWRFLPKKFQDFYQTIEENGIPIVKKNKQSMIYQYLNDRMQQSGAAVTTLYNKKQYNELTFYNVCDVYDIIALKDVAAVYGYISQAKILELVEVNDVFVHTNKIDPTPLKLLMQNKIASQSMDFEREGEDISEGAIVHEPKTGEILEDVFVMDFSRFYISIILALLVSPENNPNSNKNIKLIKYLPDGTKLDKKMFFLPALAFYLIQEREKAEIGLAQAKKETNAKKIAYYSSLRKSWKAVTSGLWGYISTVSSRYYAEWVPEFILAESRSKNIALKNYLNQNVIANYVFDVVYGDTDSSFAQLLGTLWCFKCKNNQYESNEQRICLTCGSPMQLKKVTRTEIKFDKITNELNSFLRRICDEAGYPIPITVKPEKLFDRINLVKKKFYYGRAVWEDGFFKDEPTYYVKGMQTIRSDHSQFGKDFQYAVIMSHLNQGNEGLQKTIVTYSNRFNNIVEGKTSADELNTLSKPISFKENLESYIWKEDERTGRKVKRVGGYKKYAEAAERWNKYVEIQPTLSIDDMITKSTKAKMLPVKSVAIPSLRSHDWIVFINASAIDWKKVQLNVPHLRKQNILSKIDNILTALRYSKEKIRLLTRGENMNNGLGGL